MSRIEHDFPGQREIADDLYYGVQTVRGFENFDITGIPMSHEPSFVKAFGYVKKSRSDGEIEILGSWHRILPR